VTISKDGRTILDDVTFSLTAGEKLLVVGPTGGGKSTLLNLILGLEQEYSGRVLLDGRDIREIALPALRKAIAIVPQEPFLYSMSIAENVVPSDYRAEPTRAGDEQAGDGRETTVDDLIETVNMKEEIDRFEQGIATVVGERGIMLSGGQKQRLTLARALAVRPRVLLLDDPLTHVDGYTEHLIWERLAALFDGLTVVVVSSRPVPLTYIDRAVVLANGTIADQGRPGELIARNPYMKLLYEAKAGEEN
jgi:ATP-binding cassette, subfamily B, multidrug efflux pump